MLNEHTLQPLRAVFRFDPNTPMIVSAMFMPEIGVAVTWRISRELLYRGLFEERGQWEVQVWPAVRGEGEQTVAWLLLHSRQREAMFELPVPALREWLEATYRAVPAEAEDDALDWDGFLAEVLETPASPPAA
ncbi:SsgA family sporulation/cell division regulator [Streptomyces sp. NPDC006658]|uniref:SsgA family sporulation/cell division regulator n=1 Tax=Streptomyces sp. NPDC006658 TaxID=3156900 RepID=UPI0033E706A7